MIAWGLEWHTLDTYFSFSELSTEPETPESGMLRLFAEDNGSGISRLCYKNDAGTKICFPTSGSLVTGTGVTNQVTIWTGTNTIGGDTGLTFAPSTDILTVTGGIISSDLTLGSVLFAATAGRISQDNANFFWDNTNKMLGIGNATPSVGLEIQGSTANLAQINIIRTSNNAAGGFAGFNADGAATGADELVAYFGGGGSHTGAVVNRVVTGLFGVKTAELWTATAKGIYLTLETTPTGSTTRAERFRVGPSGQLGIGGATYGSSGDIFSSGGAAAAPSWVTRATLNAALDHGALSGNGDDDHSIYALLAGRSGGQTLIGGTAVADDLILRATSGIGAGSETILLQVGNNGALEALRAGQANSQSVVAIGTSVLDITNASTLEPRFIISGAGIAHNFQVIRHTTPGGGGATQTLSSTRGAGADTHSAVQAGDGLGQLEFSGSDGTRFITGANVRCVVETTFTTDTPLAYLSFSTNPGSSPSTPAEGLRITALGNCLVGRGASGVFLAALATNATDGFLYIPSCAGTPSGTPTAFTGKIPLVYDSTNNILYAYSGGAWRTH